MIITDYKTEIPLASKVSKKQDVLGSDHYKNIYIHELSSTIRILNGSFSDILLQFSCENFLFGCTFWTFYNWSNLAFFGRAAPRGRARFVKNTE